MDPWPVPISSLVTLSPALTHLGCHLPISVSTSCPSLLHSSHLLCGGPITQMDTSTPSQHLPARFKHPFCIWSSQPSPRTFSAPSPEPQTCPPPIPLPSTACHGRSILHHDSAPSWEQIHFLSPLYPPPPPHLPSTNPQCLPVNHIVNK